jgi:hypothetical protein
MSFVNSTSRRERPMIDANEISHALYQIKLLVLIGIRATESLVASETHEGFFEFPSEDSETVTFVMWDLHDRLEALKSGLFAPKTVVLIGEE